MPQLNQTMVKNKKMCLQLCQDNTLMQTVDYEAPTYARNSPVPFALPAYLLHSIAMSLGAPSSCGAV